EVAGLVRDAFNFQIAENRFVQRVGCESVNFVHLQGIGYEATGTGERRPDRRSSSAQSGPIEVTVDAVLAEVFVDARVPLETVPEAGRVEHAGVDHGRIAGQVRGGGGSTSGWEDVGGSLGDTGHSCTTGREVRKNLSTDSVGKILFGKRGERGVLE